MNAMKASSVSINLRYWMTKQQNGDKEGKEKLQGRQSGCKGRGKDCAATTLQWM